MIIGDRLSAPGMGTYFGRFLLYNSALMAALLQKAGLAMLCLRLTAN